MEFTGQEIRNARRALARLDDPVKSEEGKIIRPSYLGNSAALRYRALASSRKLKPAAEEIEGELEDAQRAYGKQTEDGLQITDVAGFREKERGILKKTRVIEGVAPFKASEFGPDRLKMEGIFPLLDDLGPLFVWDASEDGTLDNEGNGLPDRGTAETRAENRAKKKVE